MTVRAPEADQAATAATEADRLAPYRLALGDEPPLSAVPHLVALRPEVQAAESRLNEESCTLGRAATSQVVVLGPLVSRLHAVIERAGARLQVRDLGSVNGTYVNGQRLYEPHALTNHDLIGLGEPSAHLTFVDPDATQAPVARLQYDERSMRFFLRQRALELTPNQFRLLLYMHRRRGQVCAREACAEAVWGADFPPGMDATTLDRLISTVRAALREVEPEARFIETRPGLGYQLSDGV
jgi:DNA-binding response OmpR family regulator